MAIINKPPARIRTAKEQVEEVNIQIEETISEVDMQIAMSAQLSSVIAFMIDPANAGKKQYEMAKELGINKNTISRYLQNPAIRERLATIRKTLLHDHMGNILQASIDTASTAGKEGFQDRRLLLEMAGDIGAKNNAGEQQKPTAIKVEFNFNNDWGKNSGSTAPEINITEMIEGGEV